MKEINEIEREVDRITSGMKLPSKRTRRRVATIATTMLIISAFIVSASLMTYYYEQTATVDVKSFITITDPDLIDHEATWDEPLITIPASGNFYPGETYIIPGDSKFYTITLDSNYPESKLPMTVYIHIEVKENGDIINNGLYPDGDGLLVEVVSVGDGAGINGQIIFDTLTPKYANFEIRITADELINAASTYGYTITMDWENY